MKILHLSDLHIGKSLHEYSLIDDQKFILEQTITHIKDKKPTTVIIAGDVYDRSIPSPEAIQLFEWFLIELVKLDLYIFIISGNHDSNTRLSFGSQFMINNKIYIEKPFTNDLNLNPITLQDDFGDINFYLLPFVRPIDVKMLVDKDITTYQDALQEIIDNITLDNNRNIMITHQYIVSSSIKKDDINTTDDVDDVEICDSERFSIGGTDKISYSLFNDFDYVALGHLHKPQFVKTNKIRYCGTLLKYSLSEEFHKKSLTFVDINAKNDDLIFDYVELQPKHDLYTIKDSFDNLMSRTDVCEDYVYLNLTDELPVLDAKSRLLNKYPRQTSIGYSNIKNESFVEITADENSGKKSPLENFSDFYKKNSPVDLTQGETALLTKFINDIWEEKGE